MMESRRRIPWKLRIPLLLTGVLAVGLVGIQFEGIRTPLVNRLLARANPWPATLLRVESTGGSMLGHVRLDSLSLTRDDGSVALSADTVDISWSWLPFLAREARLGRVSVSALMANPIRRSRGSLDLLAPFLDDTTSSGWKTRLASLDVRDAGVVISDSSGEVFRAADLLLRLSDLESGTELRFRLDTLGATLHEPTSAVPGKLGLSMAYDDGSLRLDTLALDTRRSSAHGSAFLTLDPDATLPDSLRGHIELNPLALGDLAGLFPGLREDAEISGRLGFGTSNGVWTADGHLDLGTGDGTLAAGQSRPVDPRPGSGSGHAPGFVDLSARWDPVDGHVIGRLTASRLRPSALLADARPDDRLDLTIDADLVGPRLDSLTGQILLTATDAVMAGINASGSLDQDWSSGRVRFLGRGSAAGSPWRIQGTAAPFVAGSEWQFDLRMTSLKTESFLEQSSVTGSGDLALTAQGRGFDLDTAGVFRLVVENAHLERCVIGPGVVAGHFGDGSVRVETSMPLCEGRFDARGRVATNGDWRIDRVRLSEFDPAKVVPGFGSGNINARLEGSGTGSSGRLAVSADSLVWDSYRIDSLAARVTGSLGNWRLAGSARVDSGAVHVDARTGQGSVIVDNLSFDRLDLAALTGERSLRTAITGRATGQVGWNEEPWGAISLDLDRSVVNDQTVSGGTVRLESPRETRGSPDAGRPSGLQVRLAWPSGGLNMDGTIRRTAKALSIDTLMTHFDALDVGAWTGRSYLETSLTGRAQGKVVLDEGHLSGLFDLDLRRGGHINGVRLDSAHVSVSASADSIAGQLETRFARLGSRRNQPSGGRLTARLTSHVTNGVTRHDLAVLADSLDAARLVAADSLESTLSFEARAQGTGFDPDSARWQIDVTGLRGQWREAMVDRAHASGSLSDGVAWIDTLEVVGSLGQFSASGRIPLSRAAGTTTAEARFQGLLLDIGTFATPLTGVEHVHTVGGRIDGSVSGTHERLSLNANMTATGIAWGDLHVADARIILSAEAGTALPAPEFGMRIDASVLSLPGTAAESLGLDASATGDTLSAEGNIRFADRRSVRFSGTADRALQSVGVDRFDLDLDGVRWRLAGPVAALRDEDGFRLENLVLDAGSGRISMGGRIGRASTDFFFSASSVRLDAIADLAGFQGLQVELDASLSASDRTGDVVVGGTLDTRIGSFGRPAADLSLRTAFRNGRIQLDGRLQHVGGATATVRGFLTPPTDAQDTADSLPIDVAVETDGFPMDWTRPFFDASLVDEVAGTVKGTLRILGDFEEPELLGDATLSNGRAGLPTLGRPGASLKMHDIEADLGFAGSTVTIRSATMRSGPGHLRASGSVELDRLTLGTVDLALTSDDFLAIDDVVYRAFVASDLKLTGTTRRPVLGGRVRVTRGDFRLADENSADAFEPVSLDPADLLTLERRFGLRVSEADTSTFVFYEALTIDEMRLEFDRDAWMRSARNPKMDVQFRGSLDVRKRPHAEPTVFGDIQVITENSRIEQFGRRFNIERGNLSFTGSPFAPDIDLAGVYRVPSRGSDADEVEIRLVATGRPDDLRVTFESDPAMELADVLSYIATGRPASGSLQFGSSTGNSYLSTAAGLAVGPISNLMENIALSGLGLDVVEIEHDGLRGLTLTAGKYVTPRFYVAASQPIALSGLSETTTDASSRNLQVSMEYEVVRDLLLSLMNRGAVLRVNLRWEHAF